MKATDELTHRNSGVLGQVLALCAYCARRGRDTHPRIPVTCLVANRMKGRAVVILSVDTTHLLMASKDSDVVGMMMLKFKLWVCQNAE